MRLFFICEAATHSPIRSFAHSPIRPFAHSDLTPDKESHKSTNGITHDPLTLSVGIRKVFIDLAGEQPIGAEKGGRKIAVEIKSFLGDSDVEMLEKAIGQYILYRRVLSLLCHLAEEGSRGGSRNRVFQKKLGFSTPPICMLNRN